MESLLITAADIAEALQLAEKERRSSRPINQRRRSPGLATPSGRVLIAASIDSPRCHRNEGIF